MAAKDRSDEVALWSRYRRRGRDTAARDALAERYLPLVKRHALKLAAGLATSVEVDELVAAGNLGLLDAIASFDPARGTRFETFAPLRIRGAMLDALREADHVSRLGRSRHKALELAAQHLAHRLGRQPTDDELAEALRTDAVSLAAWRAPALHSLERLVFDDDTEDATRPVPFAAQLTDQRSHPGHPRREALYELVRGLAQIDRLIVLLYYADGQTMSQIGRSLGISESRVSQRHSALIAQLRSRIGSRGEGIGTGD